MADTDLSSERLVLRPSGCEYAFIVITGLGLGTFFLLMSVFSLGFLVDRLRMDGPHAGGLLVTICLGIGVLLWTAMAWVFVAGGIGILARRCIIDSTGLTFVYRDGLLHRRRRSIPWGQVESVFEGKNIWGGTLLRMVLTDGSIPRISPFGGREKAVLLMHKYLPEDTFKPYKEFRGKGFTPS